MASSLRLPPSGRDFEVFHEVVVAGATTREAAFNFELSQTRVCQIVERVRQWNDEVLGGIDLESPPEVQLRRAEQFAADRLDFLYDSALSSWRGSQRAVEKERITAIGERIKTRTQSDGEPRFLLAAARLAILRGRLSVGASVLMHAEALAGQRGGAASETSDLATETARADLEAENTETDAAYPDEAQSQLQRHDTAVVEPLEEGCSASGDSARVQPNAESAGTCASPVSECTYNNLPAAMRAVLQARLGPVQPPPANPRLAALSEIQLSPDRPGATLHELLGLQPASAPASANGR